MVLTGVNLVGRFRGPLAGRLPTRRAPVYGYDLRRFSPRLARRKFRSLANSTLSAAGKAERLHRLLSGSVIHRKCRVSFLDNWVLRAAGTFYAPLLDTQNPDLLWRRGAGKCDQASLMYVAKAAQLGVGGRILGLDGHVLAEVDLGSERHVVDVDMGQYWPLDFESLRQLGETEISRSYRALGIPRDQADHTARIITSSGSPKYVRYPTAPRRYGVEKASEWVAWMLPLALMIAGALGARATPA